MDEKKFDLFIQKLEEGINTDDELIDECMDIEDGEGMKCRAGASTYWISWDGKMMPCGILLSF